MEWCLLWGYAVGSSLCSSGQAHPAYQWLSIAKGAFFLSCSICSESCCSPEQLSSRLCLWTQAASTCGSRILTQGFHASLAKVESTWRLWKGFPLLPSRQAISARGPLIPSAWEMVSPMCPRRGKHDIGEHLGDVKEYTSTRFELNYEWAGESVKNLENVPESMKYLLFYIFSR